MTENLRELQFTNQVPHRGQVVPDDGQCQHQKLLGLLKRDAMPTPGLPNQSLLHYSASELPVLHHKIGHVTFSYAGPVL